MNVLLQKAVLFVCMRMYGWMCELKTITQVRPERTEELSCSWHYKAPGANALTHTQSLECV